MLFKNLFLNLKFNDPSNFYFSGIVFFHDYCNIILISISFFIFSGLLIVWLRKLKSSSFLHKKLIEFLWTLIPSLILLFLCFESIKVLYLLEDKIYSFYRTELGLNDSPPLKVLGKQWYWSYEYNFDFYGDFSYLNYDSYLLNCKDLFNGGNRKLETEKPLVVQSLKVYPLKVSSADTLHSFRINRIGLKIDAIPGRINSGLLRCVFTGTFFGQCSEICGANHSFMPIELEVLL